MFDDIMAMYSAFSYSFNFSNYSYFFTILADAGNPAVDSDSLSRLRGFPTDDSNHRLSGDSPSLLLVQHLP